MDRAAASSLNNSFKCKAGVCWGEAHTNTSVKLNGGLYLYLKFLCLIIAVDTWICFNAHKISTPYTLSLTVGCGSISKARNCRNKCYIGWLMRVERERKQAELRCIWSGKVPLMIRVDIQQGSATVFGTRGSHSVWNSKDTLLPLHYSKFSGMFFDA